MIDISLKELLVISLVAVLALKPKDLDFLANKFAKIVKGFKQLDLKKLLLDEPTKTNSSQKNSTTKPNPTLPHDH